MGSSLTKKELGRIVDGLSLISKEVVKRSRSQNGDLQSLITSSLKKAILVVTDLSGLTTGEVREFSTPPPPPPPSPPTSSSNNSKATTSVVYFEAAVEENQPQTPSPLQPSPSPSNVGGKEVPFPVIPPPLPSNVGCDVKDGLLASEANVALDKEEPAPSPPPPKIQKRRPRERRVPSTPFSRALGFAGLGAGLAWGTIQESAKRIVFGMPDTQEKQSALSPFLSEKNAERLALALCRMRGAALKLGQMLSIQDESIIPPPILAALDIVRQGADVMPMSQLNQVLDAELGPDWSSKLISFDYEPMAAASIGQVHRAVTKDGLHIAVKIQYPGVADSIESDIENVKRLLDYTNLIPERLFLDRAMKVAKEELSRECDYELEATNQRRFRDLLSNTKGFYVPKVMTDISSKRVLATELVHGIPIDKVALLTQETRNYVAKKLLELALMELFVFRFMQAHSFFPSLPDPNWSNFLYDEATRTTNLIDFGAARDFPKCFVDDYLRMVLACANSDREEVIAMSKRLGFLTGMESEIMLEAHVQAAFVVGLPFSKTGGYDFRSTNITQSVSNLGATMLRHRLTPPPDEVYSLHRKLSGAFLACIKLGAVVPCRELLLEVSESYQFGEDSGEISSGSIS
ncbi:hypothetical protein HYC85_024741 [Camellia sinensis]|uniref:ABC1 atypical kinase-like domain-containing protein n=1 Tax=Camellia sinensis TaxID=4442 RepID=A0A7J7GAC7_CAMSI|nr:hypothetical protein HYC85_024741 [Camellia sinensis]